MPQTMRDVYCLSNCAKSTVNLEGDVVEAGVYYGATARLLARFFERTDKTIHLFDTFNVMPEANPEKDRPERWHPQRDFSLEQVKDFLSEFSNFRFYQGLFKDTLHSVADKKFCFVHVDCDLYDGAKQCCEFFYPRMVVGGVMMFHDYDAANFPGITRAVEEFFIDKRDLRVSNRYGGHHVVVKCI